MEEQRTYYLSQTDNMRTAENVTAAFNASVVSGNDTFASIPGVREPMFSTETCAYIHGGILATLFIIAMTRLPTIFSLRQKAAN